MNPDLLHTRVFTHLGIGTVIACFTDGTVCVGLESGGGVILPESDVFPPKRVVQTYSRKKVDARREMALV